VFRTTAHVYDLIYEAAGKDYAAESAELHQLIQAHNPHASSLLDVACGTGAHLGHLLAWYEVAGVDVEPGMLAEARRRLPSTVPLIQADMRSFSLQRRFDAVVCLFSSVGYMPSVTDLEGAIANMAAHLARGGVLIVDGWVRPDAWRDPGSVHVVVAESADLRVVRVSRSRRDGRVTTLEMHHLVADQDKIEHLVDHHALTLFSPTEYEAALTGAGLSFKVAIPVGDHDRYIAIRTHDG
jgi:SAM-dependent methyltransferase